MPLFLVIDRKLQQNKYTAKMASLARRQIIGGSAPINKSRRRRRQQIGGGDAVRPAHGSTLNPPLALSVHSLYECRLGPRCSVGFRGANRALAPYPVCL